MKVLNSKKLLSWYNWAALASVLLIWLFYFKNNRNPITENTTSSLKQGDAQALAEALAFTKSEIRIENNFDLILGTSLITTMENQERDEFDPFIEKQYNEEGNGYDSKLTDFDKYRLGFSIDPKTLPQSWENKLFEMKPKYENSQDVENKTLHSFLKASKSKTIFVYRPPYWLKVNLKESAGNKNPEYQCDYIEWKFSKDKNLTMAENSLLVASARNSDAILITNTNSINNKLMGEIYSYGREVMAESKNLNVSKSEIEVGPAFIRFTLEPPAFPINYFEIKNIQSRNRPRDLLATYWRGSDIYLPYGRWQYFNNTNASTNRNYAEGRTKMAAIVVSRCNSKNNRSKLTEELQKFIEVDVFGHCGTFDCRKANCFDNIRKNYKFYLSFENSNCRDYITEKLHENAYSNDLLPVVLGAHPLDYKAVAPPNSYIHVEDFESVESLGRYLLHLHQNDTLYNSYFLWKGSGAFYRNNHRVLRETCAYLHTQDLIVDKNASAEPDVGFSEMKEGREHVLPYFNKKDTYDFDSFQWSTKDERMGLKPNEWFWNK